VGFNGGGLKNYHIENKKIQIIMNMNDTREIWGAMMSDEEFKEWLELKNKIKPEEHDPTIPKGATIELPTKPRQFE
jgi:hypothetical protein